MKNNAVSGATLPNPTIQPEKMPPIRALILVGAMVGALTGLNAALLRLGLRAPVESVSIATSHGLLMVYGFLGTAITLERAVALQSDKNRFTAWAYASPIASILGTILIIIQASDSPLPGGRIWPAGAWMASMALMFAIYVEVWRRQISVAVAIQTLGAFVGLVGMVLWAFGYSPPELVPWWTGFLVFTIIGERVELARVAFLGKGTEPRLLAEAIIVTFSLLMTLVNPTIGYPLLGASLAVLMIDVLAHDVARRTINTQGLTKFMAACMLCGYAWALVAAGIWVVKGEVLSGYTYDTVVHSLTIGFALSMVMAHAPVIIPAVSRKRLPYSPVMWTVWLLLEGGLLIRVIAGARDSEAGWQFGGAVDVLAVLAFVITTVGIVLISNRKPKSAAPEVEE